MEIKLVAFDLDGTLLDDNKEILASSMEAISDLHKKGIQTVLCTGRIFVDAAYIARQISDKMLVIACNGACAGRADSKELIKKYPIPYDILKQITDCCVRNGTLPVYYTQDTEYTSEACEAYMRAGGIQQKHRQVAPDKKHVELPDAAAFYEIMEQYDGQIYKALCFDVDETKKIRVEKELVESELCYVTGANVFGKKNLEMMRLGVDKGSTLRAVAAEMGIGSENIMVFGDSDNDSPMFDMAGYPIAMERCTEGIRSRAYAVTGSNNDGGIARAIRRYIG